MERVSRCLTSGYFPFHTNSIPIHAVTPIYHTNNLWLKVRFACSVDVQPHRGYRRCLRHHTIFPETGIPLSEGRGMGIKVATYRMHHTNIIRTCTCSIFVPNIVLLVFSRKWSRAGFFQMFALLPAIRSLSSYLFVFISTHVLPVGVSRRRPPPTRGRGLACAARSAPATTRKRP